MIFILFSGTFEKIRPILTREHSFWGLLKFWVKSGNSRWKTVLRWYQIDDPEFRKIPKKFSHYQDHVDIFKISGILLFEKLLSIKTNFWPNNLALVIAFLLYFYTSPHTIVSFNTTKKMRRIAFNKMVRQEGSIVCDVE